MPPHTHWSAYDRVAPGRFRERFGLAFDDFTPGQRFQHRPGLTLSQQDNRDECLDTLNQQRLHFDAHFAKGTAWSQCLMDSTLTTKVLMGMTWKTFARRTTLLGIDEIALTGPVFGGDTLYAESGILACEAETSAAAGAVVRVRTTGRNQEGASVATLDYTIAMAPDASDSPGEVALRHRSHVEVEPGVFRESMGLYLDDLEPGEVYEHRPGRRLSAAESGLDTLRSLEHGGPLVSWSTDAGESETGINPLHILAVATGMQTKTFSVIVANLGWQQVRFPAPARDGDVVYTESTVVGVRPSRSRAGQGIVHLRAAVSASDGRTVCTFDRQVLVYARGHGPFQEAE